MRCIPTLLFLLTLLTACNAGYGPLEDHSEFTGAKLAGDGETVVFAFHRFLYRPATGLRAFPDGGIPKYETDINFLGLYNRGTQKLDILRREENRDWQPGQGNFAIQDINGPMALVTQGGQLRGPFTLDHRHILVDWRNRTLTDFDLEEDLARHDRDAYVVRLAAPDGTLVLTTSSVEEGETPNIHRRPGFEPELWVRTPGGEYLKVADSKHFEEVANGEVIYWDPETRDFFAFSPASRSTRVLPDYKQKSKLKDITEGVSLSRDRQHIEFGTKTGDQWTYKALPLKPDDIRGTDP